MRVSVNSRLRKCGAIGAGEVTEAAKQQASRKLIARAVEEREENNDQSDDSDFDD